MATELEDILAQLATIEAAITGVAAAHEMTPEALGSLPAFTNQPIAAESHLSAGKLCKGLYTIRSTLWVARGDLKVAENTARPFLNRFEDAIFTDPTLGGKCETVVGPIRATYGTMLWAETPYIGWTFDLTVKKERTIT